MRRADHSRCLYPDTRGDLVVRADRQLRQPLLAQLAQVAAHARRAQQHRAAAGGDRQLDLLGRGLDDRARPASGPSPGTRRRRSARAPRPSPARATGRARSRAACPRGRGTARRSCGPSAWRAYSASIAGSRVRRALSPIASSTAPRSRIETPSRSSACSTRWTSPSESTSGTTSSTTAALNSLSWSSRWRVSWRVSSSEACARIISVRWVTTTDSASTTVQPSASASARPDSGIQTAGRPKAGSVVGMPGS